MIAFRITALPRALATQVRQTLQSVQYPHPAHTELATGTGPCRQCLDTFKIGKEERILFTYQPFTGPDALPSPGPVFIHRDECSQCDGSSFPPGLRELPLAFDAFGVGNRLSDRAHATGDQIEDAIQLLFQRSDIDYIHMRHGEAGCFIARIDRAD